MHRTLAPGVFVLFSNIAFSPYVYFRPNKAVKLQRARWAW